MVTSIHHRDGHFGWDRAYEPEVRIAPGDEVELALADCFGGQLPPDAEASDVAAIEVARANPLTGPIAVDGAEPGDRLVVSILELEPAAVGWTVILPGFGLLADDFPSPHVVSSRIGTDRIEFGDLAVLPRRPFIGTIGVAPGAPGPHSVIPPRRVGGNLDWRDVTRGARLSLPIEAADALFSAGDPHGTQGDGEVCGTAVETSAVVRLRLDVERGADLPFPELVAPAREPTSRGEQWITTGVGPDLHTGARDATRAMIERLGAECGLDPADAYALCSVAGDLRIAEVVDAPNWVVAMAFDPSVVDER